MAPWLPAPSAALSAALLLGAAVAAPPGHEITGLPGFKGPLPSKVYAGYIDAGTGTENGTTYQMHEHYMFIEAEHNPETAPCATLYPRPHPHFSLSRPL